MRSTVRHFFSSSHLQYYAISEFFLKQSRISSYDSRVETAWWCNDYMNKIALRICCLKWKSLSQVQLSETPWTVACQSPMSMGCSRQEYWSGLPFPSPGDLPNPGIKPTFPTLQVDSLPSEPPGKPKWCQNVKTIILQTKNAPRQSITSFHCL